VAAGEVRAEPAADVPTGRAAAGELIRARRVALAKTAEPPNPPVSGVAPSVSEGHVRCNSNPFGRPKTTTTQPAGFQRFSEELSS